MYGKLYICLELRAHVQRGHPDGLRLARGSIGYNRSHCRLAQHVRTLDRIRPRISEENEFDETLPA